MDGLIMMIVSLSLIFFGFSLRNFYHFLALKEDLKIVVKNKIIVENKFEKKVSRKEKFVSKMLKYADDFSSMGQRINFFSENHEVKKLLMQAGFPYQLTIERFQGLKIFLLIIGLIIGGFMLILRFPYAEVLVILLPIGGYLGTIWWLKSKAKQRQEELSYQLPDFLDTMSVTLQAGVGLDQALRDIVPYFGGPVKDEFGRFIQETDVGVPRTEAYQSLLDRNESKEFQMLIKSLVQGEKLGVPISRTFKHQAVEMRKIKKEKIKEAAAKASPKVTLITTFIVMPSALILIGGLMIMNMFSENRNLFSIFN
ncbi:type II secretion system F family protein [Bacillus sp. B15-48]|uniref:type II secretion system F family protein n=1 Tax=Bacillus sp. B15-48 TaxID=1548601 RepID=UPI00193F84DF|nr:type II secretion system F family protein [Bacillus sp. B15-48]MBM4763245.1 pilus assembly protein TadB [Bacillus sp. B15-48]